MNQEAFRNLISGRSRGFGSLVLRTMLRLIAVPYTIAVRVRNFLYDMKVLRTRRVPACVISVGNITTGGTGKTPLVIWLTHWLRERNVKCAVLTRGYKTEPGKFTDEPAVLAKSCQGARVIVNSNRLKGAQRAIREDGCSCLVMDDGFQHRRLHRDLDIVAVDATCAFGYGWVLPAGLLREPIGSLKRADIIVLTRCDQVEAQKLQRLAKRLSHVAPNALLAQSVHRNTHAKLIHGQQLDLNQLRDYRILAFCGIGNPNAFLGRLQEYKLDVVGACVYDDHHRYREEDLRELSEKARAANANLILTTQKDWVKTASVFQGLSDIPFAYLTVELDFIEGRDRILERLREVCDLKKVFTQEDHVPRTA